jgi:hypothetical protein
VDPRRSVDSLFVSSITMFQDRGYHKSIPSHQALSQQTQPYHSEQIRPETPNSDQCVYHCASTTRKLLPFLGSNHHQSNKLTIPHSQDVPRLSAVPVSSTQYPSRPSRRVNRCILANLQIGCVRRAGAACYRVTRFDLDLGAGPIARGLSRDQGSKAGRDLRQVCIVTRSSPEMKCDWATRLQTLVDI